MRTIPELPNDDLLVGWKDIAAYLKCSVRKAQRLEEQHLPVNRIPATKSVWSSKALIDQWLASQAAISRTDRGNAEPEGEPPGYSKVREISSAIGGRFSLPGQLSIVGILFASTAAASAYRAYGLTVVLFVLTAFLIAMVYSRFPDTTYSRAVVGLFMIAGMSYAASATALPAIIDSAVNMKSLPPAFMYPFVSGIRFIPALTLAYVFLVAVTWSGVESFRKRKALRFSYVLAGAVLLTVTTSIGLLDTVRIWQAGLPITWTLFAGESFITIVNLILLVLGYRFFSHMARSGYRHFFMYCGTAYLLIALTAAITNGHWTEINRVHLDARSPVPYRVHNADAENDFRKWVFQHGGEVGRDLIALGSDQEFLRALRQQNFYKQDFDDALQLPRHAVIFGYKDVHRVPGREAAFVLIRFPAALAATLNFEPAAKGGE